MNRRYQREKVDLGLVLRLIATGEVPRAELYVDLLAQYFNCSVRAVKDSLAVLRRAGYVDVEAAATDRRQHHYRVTERGVRVLASPFGWAVLRLARRLWTTCPSPRVATAQRALSDGARIERLSRAEVSLGIGDNA
jgi:DNA-binding MarR family transcriptional regulator